MTLNLTKQSRSITPRKISLNQWYGLDDYRSIDPETFDLLLGAVTKRRLSELTLPKLVDKAFPAFDKVYWRPGRLQFMHRQPGKTRTKSYPASLLLHECVHQLFYQRFRATCLSDQTICLLTEKLECGFTLQAAGKAT